MIIPMARPRKIIDAFFVSRPVLWIPVWGFAAFGYWRGSGGSSLGDIARAFRTLKWEAFGWMLCFSASVGAVYALNQIADRDTDSRNGGFALLVHGGVSNRTACISAAILAGVSILVPLAFQPLISLLAAGSLLLGIVYSFPPCRFSGRPVLDFLSNAVGYGVIAFAAGWHLAGAALATPSFAVSTVPYFLLMCGGSISSTLPDIPGDIVDGKRTTAVAIGERRGRLVATGFIVAAAVAA
jgi:4-hydroxybenzoate polyprenyltransferase